VFFGVFGLILDTRIFGGFRAVFDYLLHFLGLLRCFQIISSYYKLFGLFLADCYFFGDFQALLG